MPIDTAVNYLIQHSETGEYLYPSSSGVTTKVLDKTDKAFQWKLSAGYVVANVSTSQYLIHGPSDATGTRAPATLQSSVPTLKWNVSPDEADKPTQLTLKAGGNTFYFYKKANQDAAISYAPADYSGHASWVLVHAVPEKVPVPPLHTGRNPLRSGSYRIRTFNGPYVLTMPDTAVGQDSNTYVSKRGTRSAADFQRWEVTLLDTGLYSIKNAGAKCYLGPPNDRYLPNDSLIGKDSFEKWVIQSNDGGVMFFIGVLDIRSLSIGFPDYEGGDLSEVELQFSDATPSQIWFFESLDGTLPGQDHIHTKSILQHEKAYYFRSCHDTNLYLFGAGGQVRLQTVTPITPNSAKSKFTVVYPDQKSGGFTLEYNDANGGTGYYVTNAAGNLDFRTQNATTWALIPRVGEGGTVYHICDADTGTKAISSRSVTFSKVVVDPMVDGDEVQFWDFIKA